MNLTVPGRRAEMMVALIAPTMASMAAMISPVSAMPGLAPVV